MQDEIKDLIYSIAAGNAVEIESSFNHIMSAKAVEAMDDMRIEVAKNMFTTPEQSEE